MGWFGCLHRLVIRPEPAMSIHDVLFLLPFFFIVQCFDIKNDYCKWSTKITYKGQSGETTLVRNKLEVEGWPRRCHTTAQFSALRSSLLPTSELCTYRLIFIKRTTPSVRCIVNKIDSRTWMYGTYPSTHSVCIDESSLLGLCGNINTRGMLSVMYR